MRWEPIDPPHTQARKFIYKRLVRLRAAFILLLSAWHMKPKYFQPDTNSFYKNLGWGIPVIPASIYAIGAQALISRMFTEDAPLAFPNREWFLWTSFFVNIILISGLIYWIAFLSFCFHSAMCFIGRVFEMQEYPPPYEFFLVRNAGEFMWFGVSICIMMVPLIALEPSILGKIASYVVAVPIIYLGVFYFAAYSWHRAQMGTWVGLDEMYQSGRFVKFFRRTTFILALLFFVTLIILARNPDYLSHLLGV